MGIPHFKNPPHVVFTEPTHLQTSSAPFLQQESHHHAACIPSKLRQTRPGFPMGATERPLIYTENGTGCASNPPQAVLHLKLLARGIYLGNEWNPGAGYLILSNTSRAGAPTRPRIDSPTQVQTLIFGKWNLLVPNWGQILLGNAQ